MSLCLNCGTDAKSNNASVICCDICQGPLHLKCVGLSEGDAKWTRARSKAIKVVCNVCNNNMSQFKDLKFLITNLQKEFTLIMNNLKADFDTQINDLRSTIIQKQQQEAYQFEDMVNETMERQNRKTNLVIFGVLESPENSTNAQATEHDVASTQHILQFIIPEYRNNDLKVKRLGKRVQARNRPLKIFLRDEQEVINFLKNSRKLRNSEQYKNISVSSDKTQKQIEFYKKLKMEMENRRRNGENNIKIRYINGVPKIVQDNLN